MWAGEGISGTSSKRRRSEDRRVIRKIFDSVYSPECVEKLSDRSLCHDRGPCGAPRKGPKWQFRHPFGLPPRSIVSPSWNYQTVSRETVWKIAGRVVSRVFGKREAPKMKPFILVTGSRETPNRGLFGLSRQSLEGKFCELRVDGGLRSWRPAVD